MNAFTHPSGCPHPRESGPSGHPRVQPAGVGLTAPFRGAGDPAGWTNRPVIASSRSPRCPARGDVGRWSPVHGRAAAVASTAWRMSWVAASGCDTNETWEAATSTIVAFARSAMNRWSAGGIALSWVPSMYQHGSVFHAGGPDGAAANAAAAYGRCAAAITAAVSGSTS